MATQVNTSPWKRKIADLISQGIQNKAKGIDQVQALFYDGSGDMGLLLRVLESRKHLLRNRPAREIREIREILRSQLDHSDRPEKAEEVSDAVDGQGQEAAQGAA